MSGRRAAAFSALVLLTLPASSRAADPAPDKATCARSYEQAQRHRQAHDLEAARAELRVCSRSECVSWMRRECATWLAEVDRATPSIVISVKDEGGTKRLDARVTIDGGTIIEGPPAQPISLAPGEHTLVVDAPGAVRVTERITLREGERDRRIELTVARVDADRPASPPPVVIEERPFPPVAAIVGGVGIVGLVTGSVFQIRGMDQRSALFDCAPSCPARQVDDAQRTLWVGNGLIAAGVIAVAVAVWLYVTRPSVRVAAPAVGGVQP